MYDIYFFNIKKKFIFEFILFLLVVVLHVVLYYSLRGDADHII